MSGRGRGRGGGVGVGRGQPRPSQGPSPGRGGGRGRGQPFVNQPAQPPVRQPPAVVPQAASSSTAPFPSPSAISALSSDVERKVSLSSQPPAQQTAPSVQTPPAAISTQLAPSSSKAVRPPARPGLGTLGRKCVVRANHFLVHIAEKDLHHYDVTITPEVLSKKVCREIVNELVKSSRETLLDGRFPAYDGRKSMYTAGALPFASKDFVVKLKNSDNPSRGDREFKVAIKFAAKVDSYHMQQFLRGRHHDTPQETIQALDVVLRSKPSDAYTVVGRSFFDPQLGESGFLGDGLDYWKGFYQSLRLTQMGLSLNVDMSARAFYSPVLVSEFVQQSLNIRDLTRPLSDQDRIKVKRALKGVRVHLTHRKEDYKRYKVSGVSSLPISQLTFPSDESGTKTHVVQYFRERYGITLKFLALPALQAGSDTKPVYLPMELCKIVDGQRYSKKLNEKQVTALLRATCQRPAEREENIKQMVKYNNYGLDEVVNDFGLQVGTELSSIDARVLPPPMLQYEGKLETPMVGCWNMINKRMVNGGKVEHWTCVSFSRMHQNDVFRFCEELVNMCRAKGMNFNPDPLIPIKIAQANHIERTLIDISTQSNSRLASLGITGKELEMLIVILPDFSGSYGKIKRICETELGIISQCCQPKQAVKCNKQYMENVSLKINVKAGGRNTVLHDAIRKIIPNVSDRPTIIFGADVTHPQPGEDSSPSIAAVVASMDWPEVTKYRGLVSAQRHRDEMIHDLFKPADPEKKTPNGGMIRELLMAFRRSTGFKPHRIIFYRDGVSEGQFNQVLLHEIDAIRKACVSLEENYLPPITFVVVQKRHHTRLFPENHRDRSATDRSGNILPGTVVDSGICHPTEFDFYLCSHAGIQGTSRPTHYHVLYDENNFTADALQKLTNNLCYTYARCTRSVSIVPPAYYAHLAAFRARYYIEGETSDGTSTATGPGGSRATTRERTDAVRPLPVIKDNVKNVMFYC